jgi:hypothetical protein
MIDSIELDTENRTNTSTLSIPVFKINRMAFLKNDKIRFSVVVPPFYNIDSSNNSIVLNGTTYSISNGYYNSIDDIISAFNSSIESTGISIELNELTGLITISHPTTNFSMNSNSLFGFTTNKTGNISYTATQGTNQNKNTISFCSNLSSLFTHLNINKQQESFQHKQFVFSFLNSSVGTYNYIMSDWLTVSSNIMFDELNFFFAVTGTPPAIINSIIYNWSVIVEIQK